MMATRSARPSADSTAATRHQAAAEAGAEAKRHAGPWIERLARLGYAAKGAVYLLVGLLALSAAVGWGGQVNDAKAALATLERHTFGTILLWAIAVGLVGYAIWQLFRAILDPEHEGNDAKAIGKRIGFAISGLVHASLAIWAFTHLLGGGGGSGGEAQGQVRSALEWGLAGRIVVGIVGAIIVGVAIGQFIKAWREDLSDQLSLSQMSEPMRKATIVIGRLGLVGRGVVFGIIGFFTLHAARLASSGAAGGFGDALQTVRGRFGWVVLAVVAAGVAAYGVFMFIMARYRRIRTQ